MNAREERKRAAMFDEMDEIGTELVTLTARAEELFARRIALWQRAVAAGITQKEMAEATMTTEGAVGQALRKARVAAERSRR